MCEHIVLVIDFSCPTTVWCHDCTCVIMCRVPCSLVEIGMNPEKIGKETILVSKEAQFYTQ